MALLLVEKLFLGKYLDRCPKPVRWVYTMFFVLIGWVIFDLTDFSQMTAALRTMFAFIPTDLVRVIAADTAITTGVFYLAAGLVCSFPLLPWLKKKLPQTGPVLALENAACLGLLVLCVIYVISMSYNPFIYFRF